MTTFKKIYGDPIDPKTTQESIDFGYELAPLANAAHDRMKASENKWRTLKVYRKNLPGSFVDHLAPAGAYMSPFTRRKELRPHEHEAHYEFQLDQMVFNGLMEATGRLIGPGTPGGEALEQAAHNRTNQKPANNWQPPVSSDRTPR